MSGTPMPADKCPWCGKDADSVETFHGARSCYHPFHNGPLIDIWQHDETGRIVELPAGSPSPGKRYYRVRGMGGRVSVVGKGAEARVVFTPDAPAPADDASGAEAMREAFLVETAARHAAQCVEYERRPVKADAMDKPMVERAVASALSEIRFVNGRGVSLASPGLRAIPLPPAPVDAVERARREFYEAATAVYAFDSEVDGRHEGRHDPRFRKLDDAAVDAYGEWQDTIAAEASAGRDGKGE